MRWFPCIASALVLGLAGVNAYVFYATPGGMSASECVAAAGNHSGTCVLTPGHYREPIITVSGDGLRLVGQPGATLSGLSTPIPASAWSPFTDNIWKAHVPSSSLPNGVMQQVFMNNSQSDGGVDMLVEARWPNAPNWLWDMMSKGVWANVSFSGPGKIINHDLPGSGVDWTGALATLNVGWQFFTWTRFVESYDSSTGTFLYNATGINDPFLFPKTNRFFLSGVLGALDIPGEWFYDQPTETLYLWPWDSKQPTDNVMVKTRDVCLNVTGTHHVVDSIAFLGCASTSDTVNTTFSNLNYTYPSHNKFIPEGDAVPGHAAHTVFTGHGNTVTRLVLKYTNNRGLSVSGHGSSVSEAYIYWTAYLGTLWYTPLGADSGGEVGTPGQQIKITNCTVSYFGNAGITPVHEEVSFTLIHHGGCTRGTRPAAPATARPPPGPLRWHKRPLSPLQPGCRRATRSWSTRSSERGGVLRHQR